MSDYLLFIKYTKKQYRKILNICVTLKKKTTKINYVKSERLFVSGNSIDIPIRYWHKATNIGKIPAKVIEVWIGKELTEDDIERRD